MKRASRFLFVCAVVGVVSILLLCKKEEKQIEIYDANDIFGTSIIESQDSMNEVIRPKMINVLLTQNQGKSLFHHNISCYSTDGMICYDKSGVQVFAPGEFFSRKITGKCVISSRGSSGIIVEENGVPLQEPLEGSLILYREKDGVIIVNRINIERYLGYVVPSEMPATYPLEALKAQAVVARAYAYYHLQNYAYPEWHAHVDDTVRFQVYHNQLSASETWQAVRETENLILATQDQVSECMYYSTSGGFFSNEENIIKGQIDHNNCEDLEKEEGWYRWNCICNLSVIDSINYLKKYSDEKEKISSDVKKIKNIKIMERDENGAVQKLSIETNQGNVVLSSAYQIRDFFVQRECIVNKNDDTRYHCSTILPSPFFYIKSIELKKGYLLVEICGAGFGHGAGMSQNGAKRLAMKGKSFDEILNYYYKNQSLQSITKCLDE